MPARQLRDTFGRQRLTEKARREIDGAMLSEGLATRPSILEADADELVTVYVAEPRAAAAPAAGPRRGTLWGEFRRMPAWLQLLVPVMAVILIASVAGGGSSDKPEEHAQTARIATQPAETDTGAGSAAEARRELRAERRRAAEARREARREAAAQRAAERHAERERRARAERRRERRREEQRELEQLTPPPEDSGGSGCDPNYTGACVPTDQGDVDCGDIPDSDFESIGSDPDRLDADGDGTACES